MIEHVQIFVSSKRDDYTFAIDKPRICPRCGQSGNHIHIRSEINRQDNILAAIFECTSCIELFFSIYFVVTPRADFSNYSGPIMTVLFQVLPNEHMETELPQEINGFYPEFHKIYEQSLVAEANGLNLITGISYRKSLEFLVKQYLIDMFPDDEQSIRTETLGQSIKRIQYPLIQKLATAATWLGNDEGHFTRKHIDYNVTDMKKFIVALSHLIVAEKVAEDASKLVD